MNKIYILRKPQEVPRVDTMIYSSKNRSDCVDYFNKSDHKECYLEEWCGQVVLVRNLLVK